jgi:hypothetical protein
MINAFRHLRELLPLFWRDYPDSKVDEFGNLTVSPGASESNVSINKGISVMRD